jgi:hypothetical protein
VSKSSLKSDELSSCMGAALQHRKPARTSRNAVQAIAKR